MKDQITPALLTEEQKHAIGNLSRRASSPQHADSPKESVSTRGPATIPACTSPPSLSPLPSPPAVRSPVPATPGPPSGPAHALASPNNFPDISAISEPITIPTNEPILPPSTRAPAATFAAAPYTPPAFRPPPHLAEMPFYTPPRPTRPRVTTRRSTSSVSRLRILQSIQPVPYSQTLMKSPEGNLVTPEALHEYGLGVA